MEMLKIEQVIVGGEMRSTPAERKSEPVVSSLQSYQHESLQCFQCFITFCNSKAKERHMRKSHRDQYKQQLQQADTLFTCYKCDKSFTSSDELSQHQVTHRTEEKPFRCSYCQKNFFTFSELNKHRRHDCKERRCPCKDCGTLFPSPSRLRTHRVTMHPQRMAVGEDVNTYQCCKCGGGFQTEEDLLQHQERFANDQNCDNKQQGKKRGRKPKHAAEEGAFDGKKLKEDDSDSATEGCSSTELKIPCPEADCDLIFPSVAALRAHKKDKHGPPPRKALNSGYSCPTCGKSFARESALKAHQHTHTERDEEEEEEEEGQQEGAEKR